MLVVSEEEQMPIQGARSGNAEAWNRLFKRYQLPLYTYVFELVHQEQTALDIVQESFVNATRYIGSLREDAKFGSWLFSIAHRKCIQHWRKRKPDEVPLDDESGPDHAAQDPGPLELLLRKEEEELFMKALEQLAPPHRAVLLLHCMEEFSLEEIAAITEAPLGTVKSRLHYARSALKKLIEKEKT